jgi:hypothetical protein
VFRRIHELHKANGAMHLSLFSLFSLFLRQFISVDISFSGGNPGPPTVWRMQEQRRRPLFCRCSPLLPQKRHGAGDRLMHRVADSAYSQRYQSKASLSI